MAGKEMDLGSFDGVNVHLTIEDDSIEPGTSSVPGVLTLRNDNPHPVTDLEGQFVSKLNIMPSSFSFAKINSDSSRQAHYLVNVPQSTQPGDYNIRVNLDFKIDTPPATSEALVVEVMGPTTGTPPSGPLPPARPKPPLPFDFELLPPGLVNPDQYRPDRVIGFVMPVHEARHGLMAMRATPLKVPVELDNKQAAVGAVQLPEDVSGLPAGAYFVSVDLRQDGDTVEGSLIGRDDVAVPLTFRRIPQVRNPERDRFLRKYGSGKDYEFHIELGISADTVWFVVVQDVEGKRAIRYRAGTDSVLSTTRNFPKQYGNIEAIMRETAEILRDKEFLNGHTVIFEKTVAMIEDPAHIDACNSQGQCDADIIGAPTAVSSNQLDSNSLIVGVVRVVQVLNIDGVTVEPGSYVVKFWPDHDADFKSATITGVTNNGDDVYDQQISAIPAFFVNAHAVGIEISSDISAFKLFGRCCFQSVCA